MRRRNAFLDVPEEPTINLTPLIDVVFVVLIAFILIAPLLEVDRVELAPSSARESPIGKGPEPSRIVVHVKEADAIFFNHRAVTLEQLVALLQEEAKRTPLSTPQLFVDKRSHFGTYQAVKNGIECAGFHTLDLILAPPR